MSVRKSFLWLISGNAAFFVVQFASSVVLARLLTAAEMGIFAISMSTIWLLNAFQNLGLPSYLSQERDLDAEKLGTALAISGLQALLLTILLWLVAPLAADMVDDARVTHSLRILCLLAFVTPIVGALSGLFQRQMRFGHYSLVRLLNVCAAAAVTIVGAYAGLSYASMSYGAVVGESLALLLSLWLLRRDLRVPITLKRWREVWHFGLRMLVAASITNICARAPNIILGRLAGVAAAGLYSRGAGLVDVAAGTIEVSIQRLMQPLLAQHRDQLGTLRRAYLRAVHIVTGAMWPAFAGLAVLAAPVITLLYGEHWQPAAPVLSLLSLAGLVNIALCCRAQVLITVGRVGLLPRAEALVAMVSLAAFAIGARYGIAAAAATQVAAAFIGLLIYAPHVTRAADVTLRDLLAAYARSLVVTVAAAGPPLLLMVHRGWPLELPLVQLLGATAAGIAAWIAAVYLVRHELRQEFDRLIRTAVLDRQWGRH